MHEIQNQLKAPNLHKPILSPINKRGSRDFVQDVQDVRYLYEKHARLKKDFEEYRKVSSQDIISLSKSLASITDALQTITRNENEKQSLQNAQREFPKRFQSCTTQPEFFPRMNALLQIIDEQKQKIKEERMIQMCREKDKKRVYEQREQMRKNRFNHITNLSQSINQHKTQNVGENDARHTCHATIDHSSIDHSSIHHSSIDNTDGKDKKYDK